MIPPLISSRLSGIILAGPYIHLWKTYIGFVSEYSLNIVIIRYELMSTLSLDSAFYKVNKQTDLYYPLPLLHRGNVPNY